MADDADPDIRRAALLLVRLHGGRERARAHALAHAARDVARRGELGSHDLWAAVAAAIERLPPAA